MKGFMRSARWLTVLSVVALMSVGCGGGGSDREAVPARATGNVSDGVTGRVTFEKRPTGIDGLAPASDVIVLPAKFVRVEAVRPNGGSFVTIPGTRTITDQDGRFGIGGEFPEDFRIIVHSTSEEAGSAGTSPWSCTCTA